MLAYIFYVALLRHGAYVGPPLHSLTYGYFLLGMNLETPNSLCEALRGSSSELSATGISATHDITGEKRKLCDAHIWNEFADSSDIRCIF